MSATILETLQRAEIGQSVRITFRLNNGGKAGLARLNNMYAEGKVTLSDVDAFMIRAVLQNLPEYFEGNRTYTVTFTSEAARKEFLQNISGDVESAEVENGA